MVAKTPARRTMADLLERLGNVPLDRIRVAPAPGKATVTDVTRILDKEGIICELVDGVLLEKPTGMHESLLAVYLARVIDNYVRPRNLGIVLGADGTIQIKLKLVRIPDVSFIGWDRFPGRKLPR